MQIRISRPQPSPRNKRTALTNITNIPRSRQVKRIRPFSNEPQEDHRMDRLEERRPSVHNRIASVLHGQSLDHREPIQNEHIPCLDYDARQDISLKLASKESKQTNPMVNQAKRYIGACQNILQTLESRLKNAQHAKESSQQYFQTMKEQAEAERNEGLVQIENRHRQKLRKIEEERRNACYKFEKEGQLFQQFLKDFQESKRDVSSNMKVISELDMEEFRPIMKVYWKKIEDFEKIAAPTICIPVRLPVQETARRQADLQGNLFTFSKNGFIDAVRSISSEDSPGLNDSIVNAKYHFQS